MEKVLTFPKTKSETKEEPKEQLTVFKNTLPLDDVMVMAKEIQKGCKDFVVPSSSIMVGIEKSSIPHMFFDNYDLKKGEVKSNDFAMSDHAFSQLCAKLGVPVRFMKKCMKDKHPEIVADSLYTYLQDMGEKTLFTRTNNDHVRGILSEKYSVLDTPDILESVNAVMPNMPIKGYFMNDERLHMRLLGEQLDVPGEDLFWGLQVDSSDVGRSILQVKFLLYKQVCTNGLTVSKGGADIFTQRHIGITKSDFISSFKEGMSFVPEVASNLVAQIKMSKTKLPKDKVSYIIQKSIANLKLDKNLEEDLLQRSTKYGQSLWGVVNSLTEVAQEYSLERRLEIEDFAGKLLMAV